MSTAPSIPGKHQSFGFRKSADSGVVALKPKKTPSKYANDVVMEGMAEAKGVNWSASKTDRFKPKKSDAYPPPRETRSDSQNSQKSAPSRMRMKHAGGGESYAQTVARKKLEEAARVPGPGSYAPNTSDFERGLKEKSVAPFNNTAKRFTNKSQSGDIGPGQYNDGIEKAKKSIVIKERHPAALHTTPFGVTAGRFGKQSITGQSMAAGTPGPGSYTQEDTGFLSQQQDKQFGRFEGGFGSVSERFREGKQQYSADIGPGAYDAVPDPQVTAALERRRHKGGSSMLSSGISREKVINQSLNIVSAADEPAPGDYETRENVGAKGPPGRQSIPQVAETPFGVTIKRWEDGKTKSTSRFEPPGPGSYHADKVRKDIPMKDAAGKEKKGKGVSFDSGPDRFGGKKRGLNIPDKFKYPEPGDYTEGVKAATSKWRTPTFNVSVKRAEALAKIVEVL